MNIIVCIKQVPATDTEIIIAPDGKSIVDDDIIWVINPYDEYGLEEALRLKEKYGGEVTVVSFGPERVEEAIRTALAMGADKGILVSDDGIEGSDSLAISKAIGACINEIGYDLIFTGQRGVDDDAGLVGAHLAEFLDIPQLSVIVKVEVAEDMKFVKVNRPIEGGILVIESRLPALITAQKGLNEPRPVTLAGVLKCSKKPLIVMSLSDLGLNAMEFGQGAQKLKVLEVTLPPDVKRDGMIIEGETTHEMAAELSKLLHHEAKVI